jgi:hypothetical protein
LPPKHQRGKQEFQILCKRNQKKEWRKNDISYRRAHRQPSTRKHLPEQISIEAKKRKKKAPAQWINETHRTELPSFSKLGAKTWILEELKGETCPGSKTENQKSRGPEKQKNRNYDENWIKIHLLQKKQTKARRRTCSNRDREKSYRSLGPAIVTGRWSEAQSHENTGISGNSSSSNPRPTDFSSKSQPEGEKKRANHGRGNVLVASLWECFLSLFVYLFVPGEKRYDYCVAHSAMGCYNL